ncbi:MAG: GNAT family N-acetyltransferase [Treponema sp.]|nr:GNAT family N-acetyltransferase [Treponema sp.]
MLDEELEYDILEYFEDEYQEYWRNEISRSDWEGAHRLHNLLEENKFKTLCGENSKLFMMCDGETLMSYSMYAETHSDELAQNEYSPWVGFVYTSPSYRNKGCAEFMIQQACEEAKNNGNNEIYVLTDLAGFYEKMGFEPVKEVVTLQGKAKKILKKLL